MAALSRRLHQSRADDWAFLSCTSIWSDRVARLACQNCSKLQCGMIIHMIVHTLQEHWAAVLDLATDTAGPGPSGKAQEAAAAQAANVRRHAVNVMDDVQRNGLAPPWDAIPHLIAATIDSSRCAASLSLHCQSVHIHQAFRDRLPT